MCDGRANGCLHSWVPRIFGFVLGSWQWSSREQSTDFFWTNENIIFLQFVFPLSRKTSIDWNLFFLLCCQIRFPSQYLTLKDHTRSTMTLEYDFWLISRKGIAFPFSMALCRHYKYKKYYGQSRDTSLVILFSTVFTVREFQRSSGKKRIASQPSCEWWILIEANKYLYLLLHKSTPFMNDHFTVHKCVYTCRVHNAHRTCVWCGYNLYQYISAKWFVMNCLVAPICRMNHHFAAAVVDVHQTNKLHMKVFGHLIGIDGLLF